MISMDRVPGRVTACQEEKVNEALLHFRHHKSTSIFAVRLAGISQLRSPWSSLPARGLRFLLSKSAAALLICAALLGSAATARSQHRNWRQRTVAVSALTC